MLGTVADQHPLIMVDPDAPSRADPKLREWQHWLVGNIPGSSRDAADGDVLSAYVGAGPPEGSGLHRYVFLLYKQPGAEPLAFDGEPRLTNTSAEGRAGFHAREFAARYGLGDPVAARVFQAAHDDYVPVLMKQLGF